MGVKRNVGGDIVCPICHLTEAHCRTLAFVQAMKWAKTKDEGATMTQGLTLRHPEVCPTCRKIPSRCWKQNGKRKWCMPMPKQAHDHYPEWFRADELEGSDKELFVNAKANEENRRSRSLPKKRHSGS